MKRLLLVAAHGWLGAVRRPPGCVPIELPPYAGKLPELAMLAGYAPTAHAVFVLAGPDFLNLLRHRLLEAAQALGFECVRLVDDQARVHEEAVLGENVRIDPGAVVGAGAEIGANTVIGANAVIEPGARIGRSSWIGAAALAGRGSRIGSHSVLGPGVALGPHVNVGDWCEISRPGHYAADMGHGTFIHPLFDSPARIHGAG